VSLTVGGTAAGRTEADQLVHSCTYGHRGELMFAFGWLLILVGIVFGVMGGLANLFLAQNFTEFWLVNLPVMLIGLGLGRRLVLRSEPGGARVVDQ
jgi:hypothetical protein